MKSNLTEIIFVIDKSGSMAHLVDDTVGGFNGFIKEQREVDGTAYLTTVLFSNNHEKLHNNIDIREVEELTKAQYKVGGGTAMLDAIGFTIEEVQNRIDNTPAENRPDNTLFVIITDGHENSSCRYTKAQIQKMIEHQTKGHGWQFIFLGANMDAVTEASSLGVANSATWDTNSLSTKAVYDSVTCAATSVRATGFVDDNWSSAVIDSTLCSTADKISSN